MASYPGPPPQPADPQNSQQPAVPDEMAERQKQFENDLRRAQQALMEPRADVFVHSANPERELTAMHAKTPMSQ